MIGITALYLVLQVVAQGILGSGLAQAASPLADAAGASLGKGIGTLLLAGASISTFGCIGGLTLSVPRMLFALARDGFLPRALAVVHPVSHAPQAAILVQSSLAFALAISGSFEKLAIFANVSVLALYFGCALGAWRLRQLGVAAQGRAMRVSLGAVAPWLACVAIVWLLTGVTGGEWLAFGACLAVASLVYVATRAMT
jgi:basic amino acid/polyamine antiporter, APA family